MCIIIINGTRHKKSKNEKFIKWYYLGVVYSLYYNNVEVRTEHVF